MKVTRVGQSCLLAVLVLVIAAIGASSASAEYEVAGMPEAGRCVKVATGLGVYKGSQCLAVERSSKKVGKYNWIPASHTEKLTFAGSGLESVLKTEGHPTIKCIGDDRIPGMHQLDRAAVPERAEQIRNKDASPGS
jgi:hypothetical protein